jgi:hypothetical protein
VPDIKWLKSNGVRIIREQSIHAGQPIYVEGVRYDKEKLPTNFELWRRYTGLGERYLKRNNKPTERLLETLDLVPETTRSEQFACPLPPRALKMGLFVIDSENTISPTVYSTRLGGLKINPAAGVGGIRASVVTVDVDVAIDPTLELRMILPWTNDPPLSDLVRDVAFDISAAADQEPEFIAEEILSSIAWAMPAESPLGWAVDFRGQQFVKLDEGETSRVSIRIKHPEPGSFAFAVQAVDSNDSDSVIASDIVIFEYDGRDAVLLDP